MREARFRGAARRAFEALSESGQLRVAALIRYLERDPEPDGRFKFPLNPADEAALLYIFDDGV